MKKLIFACACIMIVFCSVSIRAEAQNAKDVNALFPIKQNAVWGYMDGTGKIVIKPQFGSARPFLEGMAMVYQIYDQDLYIPYYIDRSGRTIWYPKLDMLTPDMIEGLIELQYMLESPGEGLAIVFELQPLGYKLGYIDSAGKYVIQPQFHEAQRFSEGLAVVCMQAGCGFINRNGDMVVKPQFEAARPFSQGLAAVSIGGKYGYIAKDGAAVIHPRFEDAGSFSEGLAEVKHNGKWGYIDKTGKQIIDAQFDKTRAFSEGMAAIALRDSNSKKPGPSITLFSGLTFNGKWGFIDMKGKTTISTQFSDASQFSDGLAAVEVAGKWGYIDKHGTMRIALQFDYAAPFFGGLAEVHLGSKMAYIDKTGKYVWGLSE